MVQVVQHTLRRARITKVNIVLPLLLAVGSAEAAHARDLFVLDFPEIISQRFSAGLQEGEQSDKSVGTTVACFKTVCGVRFMKKSTA